jgi:hypothetical protein
MKRCIARAILILTAAALLCAQQAPTAAPATRDDILHLFDVMRLHEQMRPTMAAMMKQQSAMMRETMRKRYPQITEQRLARLDAVMQESVKEFPVDAMLDDMVPVYQKHLTKPDVEAMSTFYSSPTGQKLLTEMPAMTAEAMQAAYSRMQKQMDAMMDRIEKMMEEESHQSRPAPKATTKPKTQPESLRN